MTNEETDWILYWQTEHLKAHEKCKVLKERVKVLTEALNKIATLLGPQKFEDIVWIVSEALNDTGARPAEKETK